MVLSASSREGRRPLCFDPPDLRLECEINDFLFGNLTEDLNVALRAALISTYIIQKHSMISAENSVFNSMRYAVGWLFGHNGEMEQVHIQIIRRE